MSKDIKIYENPGSLSEDDLKLLVGTDTIYNMMSNRIRIEITHRNIHPSVWASITEGIKGLYHIRQTDKMRGTYQVWLEFEEDLDRVKKNLLVIKIAES